MSLKTNIASYLQENGRLTLDQLYLFCGKEHKKTSNAERRLRELMSPQHKDYNPSIKAERNVKGAIIAYCWVRSLVEMKAAANKENKTLKDYMVENNLMPDKNSPAVKLIQGFSPCCYSSYKFGTHDPNCVSLKEKITNTLF